MKKPMLLSNDDYDLNKLDYTCMFKSKKRDGIRAEVDNTGIKNRSLKILRNKMIQRKFNDAYINLPDGITLEAEIYADGVPCREMAGICNSTSKVVPENTKLYIFGVFNSEASFEERLAIVNQIEEDYLLGDGYVIVEQSRCYSAAEAQEYYNQCIADGYEGVVLMDGRKKYKQGRVTIKQHIGFKMKPIKELDLEILGVTERFLNTNESEKNELGESFKRNTVDAKEHTGIAACFICKYKDTETKVTITGDVASRQEIWKNKETYIGAYAVVKSMDYGELNKLRHPRLLDIKLQVEK